MAEYGSATWKISLWLCNDQGLYEGGREAAQSSEDHGGALQDWFMDVLESNGMDLDSFPMQILLDLLGLVDWNEVAQDLQGDDPWPQDIEDTEEDEDY